MAGFGTESLILRGPTGITDQSTAGNDGMYNGGMGVTSGRFVLDRVDDYISIPDAASLHGGTGDFCVGAWVVVDNVSPGGAQANTVFSKNYIGIELYVYQGTAACYIGGTANQVQSASILSSATLYHIVATRSGSSCVLYVDGVSVATATNSSSISNVGAGVSIGKRQDYAPTTLFFGGQISDVRFITGGTLTAGQVADWYAAGEDYDVATGNPAGILQLNTQSMRFGL